MHETWWIDGGADGPVRAALDARGLVSIAACMAAGRREGEVLSTDRNAAALRLPGTPPVLLKWRRPRPGRRRRTFLRASRERKEARAMLEARARVTIA
ncbi:MAG: hypothetical protein ACC662_06115, partial [Planctomycetota bacterium]